MRLSGILPNIKITLLADAHPLQVNPGIGFLRTFEGFGLVRGVPFPDDTLVGSRPVLGSRSRNGFNIAADGLNDFPRDHVVVDAP